MRWVSTVVSHLILTLVWPTCPNIVRDTLVDRMFSDVGKNFSGGVVLNVTFQKDYLWTDLFTNTFTAPNTMICCTVYTKRVRKNNTSTYTNLSLKHCIVKCALYQHYAVFEY